MMKDLPEYHRHCQLVKYASLVVEVRRGQSCFQVLRGRPIKSSEVRCLLLIDSLFRRAESRSAPC